MNEPTMMEIRVMIIFRVRNGKFWTNEPLPESLYKGYLITAGISVTRIGTI